MKANNEFTDEIDSLIDKAGGMGAILHLMPVSKTQIQSALVNGDEHLNTIPLSLWDGCACLLAHLMPKQPLSMLVCVLKRVAVLWCRE
jgi:hypothetical protein